MQKVLKFAPIVLTVFVSAVFLDSLRFKFTNAPETQNIFGELDAWAATLGAPGVFSQSGVFSQYVIGTGELIASTLLIIGLLIPAVRGLQLLGALLGLAIMTGAISFHLFTPLGVEVNNDGGALFMAACGVWLSCVILAAYRSKYGIKLLQALRKE